MNHIFGNRTRSIAPVALLAAISACSDSPTQVVNPPASTYNLLYESFAAGLVLVQPIGGGQPFAPMAGVTIGMDPAASADGRRIAYAVVVGSGVTQLMIADKLTGQVKPVTNGEDFDEQPSFSPDGQHVAFVSDRDGGSDIYVMKVDGTERKRLTVDPLPGVVIDRSPVWSPDGSKIVWANNSTGFMQVWVMNADGSNQKRVVNDGAFQEDPVWSPDGARIAYFEVVDLAPKLIVVNADGSNRVVLPTPANGVSRFPAWSPDGALIAFTFLPKDQSRPQIYTMKSDGSDVQRRTFDANERGGHRAVFLKM